MRARLGRIISPLCEKTRSTGADVAGEHNTRLNSSLSLVNLSDSDKIGGTVEPARCS